MKRITYGTAILIGAAPLLLLGILPGFEDYSFWGFSSLKYAPIGLKALFAGLYVTALYGMLQSWDGTRMYLSLEKRIFDASRGKYWAIAAMIWGWILVVKIPMKYDLVGDNQTLVKWVIHPFEQGQSRAIPNTMLFHYLLHPWIEDPVALADHWRWLSRILIVPFIGLTYLASREFRQGKLLIWATWMGSAVIYNYFGHLEYYSLQCVILNLGIWIMLRVYHHKISAWVLLPVCCAITLDYAPAGIILILPSVYILCHRKKEDIRRWCRPWMIYGILSASVIGGVCLVEYLGKKDGSFIPVWGGPGELSAFSKTQMNVVINMLFYTSPLWICYLIVGWSRIRRLAEHFAEDPFRDPDLCITGLLSLSHIPILIFTYFYYGWYDFDLVSVGAGMFLIFLCTTTCPSPSSDPKDQSRGWGFFALNTMCMQWVITAGLIGSFCQHAALDRFTNYFDQYSVPTSNPHRGNRGSILLGLHEYQTLADWMDRTNSREFPISMLNWRDVLLDYEIRKNHDGREFNGDDYLPLTSNPWFTLSQIEYLMMNQVKGRQVEGFYQFLKNRWVTLPPSVKVGYGVIRIAAEHDAEGGIALTDGLYEYFEHQPSKTSPYDYRNVVYTNKVDLGYIQYDVSLGVTYSNKLNSGYLIDRKYQALYLIRGANLMIVSNMTLNSPKPASIQ